MGEARNAEVSFFLAWASELKLFRAKQGSERGAMISSRDRVQSEIIFLSS